MTYWEDDEKIPPSCLHNNYQANPQEKSIKVEPLRCKKFIINIFIFLFLYKFSNKQKVIFSLLVI